MRRCGYGPITASAAISPRALIATAAERCSIASSGSARTEPNVACVSSSVPRSGTVAAAILAPFRLRWGDVELGEAPGDVAAFRGGAGEGEGAFERSARFGTTLEAREELGAQSV